MSEQLIRPLSGDRRLHVVVSERSDGDMAPLSEGVEQRRCALLGARPASWLRQEHGTTVIEVGELPVEGVPGDALVSSQPGHALGVVAADCVPLVLVGSQRWAVVHAGWRGLRAGVVEQALDAVGPAPPELALIGPAIRGPHYRFGADDLAALVERVGSSVATRTAAGEPAADVAAGVTELLSRAGARSVEDPGWCTSSLRWFSHRLRAETARHALVAWVETPVSPSRREP